jgi:hypothetical protein
VLDIDKFSILIGILCIYSTDDPKKTEHLLSLDGAKERLQLFKASLLEEGSFDSVVDGCQGVFHTASPAIFASSNPQVHPMILFLLPCAMYNQYNVPIFAANMMGVVWFLMI